MRRASRSLRSLGRRSRTNTAARAGIFRAAHVSLTGVQLAPRHSFLRTFRHQEAIARRSFSSESKAYGNGVIGIVREVYSIWERRVPLTPKHVAELVRRGLRVLVQPSDRRIFSDEEYRKAGAEITDDLSPAGTIIGVKQVQKENLLPNRTYMFFSHTIKAQPENMPLLDEILKKNVRLIDYECIVDPKTNKRLVAFGEYAGYAGMIDILRGIGGQLLGKGFGTPFLNIGSTYMYDDLAQVKEQIVKLGEKIRKSGLPNPISPLTFVFTGNGKVSQGAQDIFKLLPHRWVSPEELVQIARGEISADNKTLYGTVIGVKDMVRPKADAPAAVKELKGREFVEQYYRTPEHFEACFHETLAPYTSVLVNCMYWDMRYPRLLSCENMKKLSSPGGPLANKKRDSGINARPFAVSDITCDIGGSIEFNFGATLPEDPFYIYDPHMVALEDGEEAKVTKQMSADGVLVGAVDILPSELPKDASEHFSRALFPLMESAAKAANLTMLPAELQGATITLDEGILADKFQHIQRKREFQEKLASESSATDNGFNMKHSKVLRLRGHLFDSNLINTVLSYIEDSKLAFRILDVDVGVSRDTKTTVMVQVLDKGASEGDMEERISACVGNLRGLVQSMGPVAGNPRMTVFDYDSKLFSPQSLARSRNKEAAAYEPPQVIDNTPQKVVIFGAGRMVGPVIRYLQESRRGGVDAGQRPVHITLADVNPEAAQAMCRECRPVGEDAAELLKGSDVIPMVLPVSASDESSVRELVRGHDVAISLVPAQFHADIAKICVDEQKNMVTASYVSPAMEALNDIARDSGITIVNEVGVDPGIDHMSALALIERIRDQGGRIESFMSICGGLPAPDAADNPLGYKFSWSPRGVLTAGTNDAIFLQDGKEVHIEGKDLYSHARPAPLPFPGNPSFALEYIPNRNSLPYKEMYGLQDALTVMRGTYRYRGYCDLLMAFTRLGLVDFASPPTPNSWLSEIARLAGAHDPSELKPSLMSYLTKNGIPVNSARRAVSSLEWLGALSEQSQVSGDAPSIADAFCSLLEQKLTFKPGERDLLVMNHECIVSYPQDVKRPRDLFRSQLIKYGDADCIGGKGETAMARLVGVPTSIATDLLLRGVIRSGQGIIRPMTPAVYEPMLAALKAVDIECMETVEPYE